MAVVHSANFPCDIKDLQRAPREGDFSLDNFHRTLDKVCTSIVQAGPVPTRPETIYRD